MRHFPKIVLLTLAAGVLSIPASAAECRRFELSVVVDGVALAEYPWRDRVYVEALRGRPFSLRLSNPTSEPVAVAISVDGRNVIDAKRTTSRAATKWVLSPGQTVDIPGWQVSGETARRFFFTETARSYAKWLGDTSNVGTVEAVFFRERHRTPPIALEAPRRKDPQSSPNASGSQGQGGPGYPGSSREEVDASAEAPSSDRDRRDAAAEKRKSQPAPSSGMIAPKPAPTLEDSLAATGIGERTSFPVRWVDFDEDPTPVARISLRYEYRRELARLGVLPQRDELYARERARGFVPEYAPDPDRHRAQ